MAAAREIDRMHPVFRDSPVPRYAQLAELFRQRISRGLWPVGHRLPTLIELTRQFGVARVTVRQAVELLARDGLLSAQQGRGTFVTAAAQPAHSLRLETSLRALADVYRDDKPELTLIEEARSMPPLLAGEGAAAGAYRYLRRIHSRRGVSYCVISIYLAEPVFRMAARRFRSETVIPVLLDLPGVRIANARQTVTVAGADVEVAGYLGIALNAPVAQVRRICTDAQGRILYLGDVTYRGDHIHFEMDLKP